MKKAQALVEIVVAIGVAVLALLSISRISSRSIFNTGSAMRQNTAAAYAQNGIGIVRSQIDAEGLAAKANPLYGNGSTWCFNGAEISIANGTEFCSIPGTEFEGQVRMARESINNKDELTAIVEIRWQESGFTRSVKNEAKIILDQ